MCHYPRHIMKLFVALCLFASVVAINAKSTQGVCNPTQSCSSSTECAVAADDLSCRCSFLNCKDFGEESCGGGCVLDSQCQQWGGDESCTCSWWFECESDSRKKEPGYQAYAKLMMAIKKDKIQERLRILTSEMKAQEDVLDQRLRKF